MTDKDKVFELLNHSNKLWTLSEIAKAIDCTNQRTKAILLSLEFSGDITRININNKSILYTDNFVYIDWITNEEYLSTLSIKEKIIRIALDKIEEWLYNQVSKERKLKMYHKIYESAIRQIDNGSMTKTEAIEWIRSGYHSEQNKKKAIRLIEIHYLGKEKKK